MAVAQWPPRLLVGWQSLDSGNLKVCPLQSLFEVSRLLRVSMLICVFGLAFPLLAEDSVPGTSVAGVVMGPTNAGVAGARITLKQSGAASSTTSADATAVPLFAAIQPGNYELVVGPGYVDLDVRWSRDFYLVGAKKDKGPTATLGLDAFNVLNHVNCSGYVGVQTLPFFMQPVSALPVRRLQASFRIRF